MTESPITLTDPEITPEAFVRLRSAAPPGTPDVPLLLDVREPWEFQAASLPDSLLMPMGDVTSRAHAELDPDAHIVVLCHHGQRSLSVAKAASACGFACRTPVSGSKQLVRWRGEVKQEKRLA